MGEVAAADEEWMTASVDAICKAVGDVEMSCGAMDSPVWESGSTPTEVGSSCSMTKDPDKEEEGEQLVSE